jgi:acyl carrier protein
MNDDQARAAVAAALAHIAPEADLADVDPDGDLREQLDLDSMDFLGLVVRLHEITGVEISEDDYGHFEALSPAVAFLVARSATAAPA